MQPTWESPRESSGSADGISSEIGRAARSAGLTGAGGRGGGNAGRRRSREGPSRSRPASRRPGARDRPAPRAAGRGGRDRYGRSCAPRGRIPACSSSAGRRRAGAAPRCASRFPRGIRGAGHGPRPRPRRCRRRAAGIRGGVELLGDQSVAVIEDDAIGAGAVAVGPGGIEGFAESSHGAGYSRPAPALGLGRMRRRLIGARAICTGRVCTRARERLCAGIHQSGTCHEPRRPHCLG